MSQSESNTIHWLYTLAQLSELVGVPKGRIRAWVRAGLVQPPANANGELQFDFRQITAVKRLAKLTQAGVRISRLRPVAWISSAPGFPTWRTRWPGWHCWSKRRSMS
jgi:hypothetical protein